MSVGNVFGKEPGAGARHNDGKPPYRFIPWGVLADWASYRPSSSANERLVKAARLLASWEFRESELQALTVATVSDLDNAAKQFAFGAIKYDDWNWALGMPWSIPNECAKRHFVKATALPGSNDEESGVLHTGAFWCNVVMLQHLSQHYPAGDDRPGADGKLIPYENNSPGVLT